MKKTVELGDTVKDSICGFEGVALAMTYWLNGCVRVTVAPTKLDKDKKIIEGQTFDIEQLVVVKKASHKLPESPSLPPPDRVPTRELPRTFVSTGGDRPDVARRPTAPKR